MMNLYLQWRNLSFTILARPLEANSAGFRRHRCEHNAAGVFFAYTACAMSLARTPAARRRSPTGFKGKGAEKAKERRKLAAALRAIANPSRAFVVKLNQKKASAPRFMCLRRGQLFLAAGVCRQIDLLFPDCCTSSRPTPTAALTNRPTSSST